MRDERAVSTVVSYALIITITLALTTSLLIGAEALIDTQREQAVREQLNVVGDQLSTTISTADRLNATDKDPTQLILTRRFPDRIAGSQYQILIAESDAGTNAHTIYLESVEFRINVSVQVQTPATDLKRTRVNGGTLQIRYDESNEWLVVESA